MTEVQHQRALIRWAHLAKGKYPDLAMLVHVPNEGKRSRVAGARLKQAGLRPGFPDLFLFVPRGPYHGLAIELKADNGQLQSNQRAWIAALRCRGYKVEVCYGWESAYTTILRYLVQ